MLQLWAHYKCTTLTTTWNSLKIANNISVHISVYHVRKILCGKKAARNLFFWRGFCVVHFLPRHERKKNFIFCWINCSLVLFLFYSISFFSSSIFVHIGNSQRVACSWLLECMWECFFIILILAQRRIEEKDISNIIIECVVAQLLAAENRVKVFYFWLPQHFRRESVLCMR